MNGNVERIQRRLKESTDMMCMVHDEYHADESFANGAQWEDPQKRKNMGRTVEVFNRVPNLVNGVVNVVKQAPPAIKIIPLGEGAEQEYASIVASRIRAVEQQCSASKSRMHALKCAVKGGIGVWKTLPKSVKGQVRSVSQAIKDPTTVFPDAFSKEIDFSDAKWMIEKNKASCFGIMAAYPDSEYANHTIKGDEDKMVDILEEWEIVGDDDLVRTIICEEKLVSQESFPLNELPYSFVLGDYYQDEDGTRHYSSVTRLARADQIAVNYAENEWISDIETTPKAKFLGDPDTIEDYESDWKTAHKQARMILKAKNPQELVPITHDTSGAAVFSQFSASHKQQMAEITGVIPATQNGLELVSGKSAKLQISQNAVSTYHYIDSLNFAVQHDGEVYLDQLIAYDADGSIRPLVMEDGFSTQQATFGGMVPMEGVKNVDIRRGQYGVKVSNGPSYGSQLEQIQDLFIDAMKVPGMEAVAPVLFSLIVRRAAIPESEDVIQFLNMQLPPQMQQLLAAKGDKGAALSMAFSQLGQAQQQLQAQGQQIQMLNQKLMEAQHLASIRADVAAQNNAAKAEQIRVQGEQDRATKSLEGHIAMESKQVDAGNQIIVDAAKRSPFPFAGPEAGGYLVSEGLEDPEQIHTLQGDMNA